MIMFGENFSLLFFFLNFFYCRDYFLVVFGLEIFVFLILVVFVVNV